MTRRIFSFDPPDRFICGAVGQPGQRTFFLQARKGGRVVSVALEKVQVAVLAERLATLLLALRESGVPVAQAVGGISVEQAAAPALSEPIEEEFRVGTLTIAWDGSAERVVIEAREMTDDDEAGAEEAGADESDGADGPDLVRVHLPPADAQEFAVGAVAVVQAGRPPCPMCGAPLDPGGHFCPRRNGLTH
jgi:uncharacterized repeat protein (TIGR03847 family)